MNEALKSLDRAYLEGSYIRVKDAGCGMSKEDLEDSYLTVGTPSRLLEKKAAIAIVTDQVSRLQNPIPETRLPLGEKGIGRLSAMRLGHFVRVVTKKSGATHWNHLKLDWRPVGRPLPATWRMAWLQVHPYGYWRIMTKYRTKSR